MTRPTSRISALPETHWPNIPQAVHTASDIARVVQTVSFVAAAWVLFLGLFWWGGP